MVKLLLPLLLLSCSCSLLGSSAPPKEQSTGCYTYCGIYAERVPDGWSCADLQWLESLTISEILRHSNDVSAMMGARTCDLHYWTLHVVNAADWKSSIGEVLGVTSCKDHEIFINNTSMPDNSFVHELVHALQGCKSFEKDAGEDDAHFKWKENGLYRVISRVTEASRGI